MKDINQQIDEMIGMYTSAPSTELMETQPPSTEPMETQPPSTEVVETNAPETSAPETTAPETTAPHTEPPETLEDKIARIERENENLRKRLSDGNLTQAPGTKAPSTKSPGTSAPSTSPPIGDLELVGEDVDLEELTADKEKFNKFLNDAFKKFAETFQPRISNELSRSVPGAGAMHLGGALHMVEDRRR